MTSHSIAHDDLYFKGRNTCLDKMLGCTWRKTLLWMSIGTVVWSFIIAIAAAAGFSLFR